MKERGSGCRRDCVEWSRVGDIEPRYVRGSAINRGLGDVEIVKKLLGWWRRRPCLRGEAGTEGCPPPGLFLEGWRIALARRFLHKLVVSFGSFSAPRRDLQRRLDSIGARLKQFAGLNPVFGQHLLALAHAAQDRR